MSCDVGEVTEWLKNELSFFNSSVTAPTSQIILKAFRRFPTSQALHLHHLASRPWLTLLTLYICNVYE